MIMTIKMMMVVLLVIMAIMMLMMNLSVSKLSSALIAKFEIVLSLARRSYLYCGIEKFDKKNIIIVGVSTIIVIGTIVIIIMCS